MSFMILNGFILLSDFCNLALRTQQPSIGAGTLGKYKRGGGWMPDYLPYSSDTKHTWDPFRIEPRELRNPCPASPNWQSAPEVTSIIV
jgi:hypothetical protein